MTKWIYAVSAAAVALAAPAIAKPDDAGKGKGQSAQARGGPDRQEARGNRGNRDEVRVAAKGKKQDREDRIERRDRDDDRRDERRVVRLDRDDERRVARLDRDDDRDNRRFADGVFVPRFGRGNGLIDGCPPGLDKKNNGCLPPGQAKKIVGAALAANYARSALTGPYANWYRDDDRYLYRMGDYGIYRVDRSTNLINALIPTALSNFGFLPVGQTYPSDYNYYNVPHQYQSYYPDGGDYAYRYGNGAIYGIDPKTSAIQSIVALLAGDLAVGQRLPQSYGVYNVPMAYRDRYYDTADTMYRYNDGYVYQVDPKTQLITAIINAIV